MITEKFFQWQNPILCKSIYPMREEKLRDFLVFFNEIDLWAAYKDKHVSDLKSEIEAALRAKSEALVKAFEAYNQFRSYFLNVDVSAAIEDSALSDEKEIDKINQVHSAFIKYLPQYEDVRKEEYFVKSQMTQWKEHCRILQQQVEQKQRRLKNIAPDHPRRAQETEELERMQATLRIANQELERLRAFSDAIAAIKERRLAFDKEQKKGEARKEQIDRRLEDLSRKLKPLEPRQQELASILQRLKSPPNFGDLQAYFFKPDVSSELRSQAPQIEQPLIDQINHLHKALTDQLGYSSRPSIQMSTIQTHTYNWGLELKKLEKEAAKLETDLRNMPPQWSKRPERERRLQQIRDVDAKIMTAEIEKIKDFSAALEFSIKPKDELVKDFQANEAELKKIQQSVSELRLEEEKLKEEAKTLDAQSEGALNRFMTTYVPDKEITVRDVVIWKGDAYKASLSDKGQMELLELVAKRFWSQPERYPIWLQYMVVHFSGMRYASAHGSWADPKDLLVRMQAPSIEAKIKALDDEAIEKLCQEKIATYESPVPGTSPKLALAKEKDWRTRVGWNLPNIKSHGPKTRRRGLMELTKDEFAYEISLKSTQEVLKILLSVKGQFPDWAWKQIIGLTPLRTTEVTDPDWENFTSNSDPDRFSRESSTLRLILSEWRSHNTTLWRQEHERTQELIVTRAVCNETAEHCQHLRGHRPPGGLTSKPDWYLKNERENKISGDHRAYYVRPASEDDFTMGASILWLRFVNSEPNAWQIAKNITTKDGVGIMPDKRGSKTGGSGWVYQSGSTITRSRKISGEKNQRVTENQWLRWIHEATVAEVCETAEGKMVLTYETALPDDDRGTSAIGVFMKPLYWFLEDGTEDDYNRCFVGYVPEGQLPVENIARMLDWEKILLRPVKPDEIRAYQKVYPFFAH